MTNNGIVNIHGKEYMTVAGRIALLHADKHEGLSITTEFLPVTNSMVVCKATVVCSKGTFTGTSAANPLKPIEKMSPYEVAETSAVGRALGFAGYGAVDSIASADEIVKATVKPEPQQTVVDPDWITAGLNPADQAMVCETCGAEAELKEGTSVTTNKPYKGVFCSKDRDHVKWLPTDAASSYRAYKKAQREED